MAWVSSTHIYSFAVSSPPPRRYLKYPVQYDTLLRVNLSLFLLELKLLSVLVDYAPLREYRLSLPCRW